MIKKASGSYGAKRRMRGGLAAVVVVAIVAVALAGRGCIRRGTGDETGKLFFPVAEGPLTISVTESGTVKPAEQEILKSELEGQSTILYLIPEGTSVKKGELLVELDATAMTDAKVDQEIRVKNAEAAFIQSRENLAIVKSQSESDIDQAELTLLFAREDVGQYKEGEYPNALKEHEAEITLAKEELQQALEKEKWSAVLYKEKYLSESELQADRLAVKKATLNVELAESKLSLLKAFTYKRALAQLESAVKQAEMALERIKRKSAAGEVQAEADHRAKTSEFERQKDKLAKLTEQIAKARIVAPRDGVVIYATSAKPSWRRDTEPLDEGRQVREREELIYLPTASTFKAEVRVHESNMDKIHVGMPVRITIDALPGKRFTGKVASIAPLPDASSMFMNPDLKVYPTEIAIDGTEDLRTGMSCQAEIVVEQYASALYVPIQSVVRIANQPTVYVKSDAGVVPKPVQIGLDNNRMVRIVDGLEEGEEVLLTPPISVSRASEEERARNIREEMDRTTETATAAEEGAGPQSSRREGDKTAKQEKPGDTAERKREAQGDRSETSGETGETDL